MPLVSTRVFLATGEDFIPPFSFQISGANSLILRFISYQADKSFWSAGWLNAYELNAMLPTFRVLSKWQRLPLGSSLFELPTTGMYEIEIKPHDYIRDIIFQAWAQ
jgi:hypothetical protein